MSGSGAGADLKAWNKYPHLRCFYNKLYLAELFGYPCGPAGVEVPKPDNYIVRPIINMAGMGCNARIQHLDNDTVKTKVPPGYFWSQRFIGRQLSIDYVKEFGIWRQLNAYEGFNFEDDLSRFSMWKRVEEKVEIPFQFKPILDSGIQKINFECILTNKGAKVFEVHLRNGMDLLMDYDEIVPVFKGDPQRRTGYRYIEGLADGWGQLLYPRIGYLVKPISSSEKRSKL